MYLGERTLVDVSRGITVPAAKRGVGMIFQDPTSSLNPRMRVRDVVGEGLRLAGVGRRGDCGAYRRCAQSRRPAHWRTSTAIRISSAAVSVSALVSPAPS